MDKQKRIVHRARGLYDHILVGPEQPPPKPKGSVLSGRHTKPPQAKARLREHHPDALVVDLALWHGDGMEVVRDARRRYPDIAILVLSMQDERVCAPRLIAAGANGYLMKNEAVGEFVKALCQVLEGGLYLSRRPASRSSMRC